MGAKAMEDYIPILKDQGMPNISGAYAKGQTIQYAQAAMPADGIIVFADNGMADMASTTYGVFIHNHTGAVQGTVALAARTKTQITIVGPTTADVLDIMLVGPIKGQQY